MDKKFCRNLSTLWFYISDYLSRSENHNPGNYYVRCNPTVRKSRQRKANPDIVIFKGTQPAYFIELKFHIKRQKDSINLDSRSINKDLSKLRALKNRYADTFKEAFLIYVFDADEVVSEPDRDRYEGVSFIPINVRRNDKGYLRKNYNEWRNEFDRIFEAHGL